LYGAFKRHFDDIWHNKAVYGKFQKENIDLETSAGGIVIAEEAGSKYVALLRRHDGYWVLPKGHRMLIDDNLEQTAIREVSEETGLDGNEYHVEKLLGYYSYDEIAETLNVTKVVHLFLMRCNQDVRPALKPPEHAEAVWWDITRSDRNRASWKNKMTNLSNLPNIV
jgi:8-oxo-dGTP pyrophosphatase MutT (NUDIX family)